MNQIMNSSISFEYDKAAPSIPRDHGGLLSPTDVGGMSRSRSTSFLDPFGSTNSSTKAEGRLSRSASFSKLSLAGMKTVASVPRKLSTVVLQAQEQATHLAEEALAKSEKAKVTNYELEKFSSITTFHGLVRLYHSKPIMKVFWIVVIVLATSLFCSQVYILLRTFLSHPTITEVTFDVHGDGILFPSVTICNYNPVKRSYLEAMNTTGDLSKGVLEYILLAFLQVENLYDMYSNETLSSLHNAYEDFKKKRRKNGTDFDLATFFYDGGYTCEDMFLECSFGGRKMNCCQYAEPILTDLGRCYQFRRYSQKDYLNKQYISGAFYGLQIIFNLRNNEYPEAYMENFFETGLRFFVHTKGVLPILSAGGTAVGPGRRIYAGIVPRHFTLLPRNQWGNCKPSWDEPDVNYTDIYSSSNCEVHCVAHSFMNKCGCVPLRYQLNQNMTPCTPFQLYNCIEVNHWNENEEYWYKMCPDCLIECDRWDYAIETSYVTIPNVGSRPYLMNKFNMSEGQLVADIVIMNIFMKELAHTEFQQRQGTGVTETLSDIGGNMGLFVGASIITVAEVSVFLIRLVWGHFSKKRRKNLVRKMTGVKNTNMTKDSNKSSAALSTTATLEDARQQAVRWYERYNAEQMEKENRGKNEQPRSPPPIVTFTLDESSTSSSRTTSLSYPADQIPTANISTSYQVPTIQVDVTECDQYNNPCPPRRKSSVFNSGPGTLQVPTFSAPMQIVIDDDDKMDNPIIQPPPQYNFAKDWEHFVDV